MADRPVLTLLRDEGGPSFPDGTFGLLTVPGHALLNTVEDDWLGNQRGVSCIPEGEYLLQRSWYHKHGYEVFEVTGVPNRSRILIHPANREEDVEGCIGPGLRRGMLPGHDEDVPCRYREEGKVDACPIPHHWKPKRAVLESREAFRLFMSWMGGVDEALFRVRWIPGLPR